MAIVATLSFDTLAFVKKLEARGATPELAEGIIETLAEANAAAEARIKAEIQAAEALAKSELNTLATKADVEKVRAELKMDIEKVRSDLKVDIEKVRVDLASTKTELLKWYVGIAAAQFAGFAYLFIRLTGKA